MSTLSAVYGRKFLFFKTGCQICISEFFIEMSDYKEANGKHELKKVEGKRMAIYGSVKKGKATSRRCIR